MKDYAFIFDMDGVIVDSNPYHKIALQQFCIKHGHPLTEEQLRTKIYGRTNKEWIAQLFGQLTPEQVARYADEKEALFRDLYKNDIRPVKGLIPFLQAIDASSITRAIGTSAPRANVDFTLSGTGTTRFFKVILDESFVTKGKPNPEIYLKVAQALKLPPQQCVVIEDSLSGIAAGKEAGSKVIGITTTHTKAELASTDMVIDDFEGLEPKNVLKMLFGGI
ncbi:MAG TPA: HAD family phosphatase [Cyclobacteriaceae bacterium]|nr:HAD family phosphatase [Cyclobacteriaceae bacterium]